MKTTKAEINKVWRKGDILSEWALQYLEKCIKKDKKLQAATKKVKKAVELSPNHVTFEDAKKQVEG